MATEREKLSLKTKHQENEFVQFVKDLKDWKLAVPFVFMLASFGLSMHGGYNQNVNAVIQGDYTRTGNIQEASNYDTAKAFEIFFGITGTIICGTAFLVTKGKKDYRREHANSQKS